MPISQKLALHYLNDPEAGEKVEQVIKADIDQAIVYLRAATLILEDKLYDRDTYDGLTASYSKQKSLVQAYARFLNTAQSVRALLAFLDQPTKN